MAVRPGTWRLRDNNSSRERCALLALEADDEQAAIRCRFITESTPAHADGESPRSVVAIWHGVGARRVYQRLTETRDVSDDGASQIVDLAEALG